MLTSENVARWVEMVWGGFGAPDSVRVKLEPVSKSSPISGRVVWTGRDWLVLVPEDEEPREVLRLLFHELKHVLRGDAPRKNLGDLARTRAAMRGEPWAVRQVSAELGESGREAAHLEAEQDCNRWAAFQVEKWWGTLEAWGEEPRRAADVALSVMEEVRRMG